MSKRKKPLLIPFCGGSGNLYDWAGYGNPDEAGPQGGVKHWDTVKNREVCRPDRPPLKSWKRWRTVYDTGAPAWGRTEEYEQINTAYEEQLEAFFAAQAEFDRRLAAGEIIEVPRQVWVENYEFDATLEVVGTRRGRSAARFILRNTEGRRERYELFMTSVLDLLLNFEVSKAKITGRWTFCKRGANYSLKPVISEPKVLEELPEDEPKGEET